MQLDCEPSSSFTAIFSVLDHLSLTLSSYHTMAEIATGLAQTIITQLGSHALQEIGSALGVKKEVERLKHTLTAINDVLPDAENRQLSNNNVKNWLRRIKDAAYDAEDVIDGFATDALRKKLVVQGSIINRVRHFASSSNPILLRFKAAHRIKQVREDLNDIFKDQSFGLSKIVQENSGFISESRQTHSFIPEEQVVGRVIEREEIVKLLLDSSGRDSLSVIPIQGMGGIGKTTLAQLVYNDKRVVDSFKKENMMWVCVSDEFDVKKIVVMIIKSATNNECPDLDMDQLQTKLRRHLEGKRYLLVLDDVWNEDLNKWEELRNLLTRGASGSKIIVTTRSGRVGSIMGTTVVQRLAELSEAECWNLFKGMAFKEGEEEANPDLVEIGRDIAKKCAGVPLAAKTLGGLCYQAKKQMWEFVRDNDVWRLPEEKNGILRALRISYNHLPFYLKQCFAYCSIFPKDFKIQKDVLIQLWIAQGFINSFGDTRSPEDIGDEYVEVLMWRSFFQEPEVDDCDNLVEFKMHDLVHDLAKSIAGVECYTVCDDKEENFPGGVRHLFFNVEKHSSSFETPSVNPIPSNIRTLVFASKVDFSVGNIFSSLMFLRVLQFKNDHIDHLPNSIDRLKHLRYLQIECPEIKKLPESVSNLLNLQVLRLRCNKLEKLPDKIQNMVNLKHIDFLEAELILAHMPVGLEQLKSLQTLSHFVVSKDNVGFKLNELNALANLGGTLVINNLGNMKNANECEETNLKTKRNLQKLRLYWGEEFVGDISSEAVGFEVLKNLEPHSNLKILEIKGYVGTGFPLWMIEPSLSLPHVVRIELWNCGKCEQLFPFSRFPSLKVLVLREMYVVKCIEGTPEKSQKEWFPSLRELTLYDCPNLECWFPLQSQQQIQLPISHSISFPSLVELEIWNCPKLKNMPLLFPSTIKSIFLESCYENDPTCLRNSREKEWLTIRSGNISNGCSPSLLFLHQQIQHITALQLLYINDYYEEALPEWIGNLTSLQTLWIDECPNLQILPESIGNITSLHNFWIKKCPNLQILPEWVLRVNTTIQFLEIKGCPQLTRRYNKETGEDRHQIAHIGLIKIFA